MKIFDHMSNGGYEQLVFCHDGETGLKAIIAIHDTTLGPALGGTRMWPYRSEEEAIVDVLRLARGMTYKAAVAGLSLGGGKAVIIGDPAVDKTEDLLRAYGRFVDTLKGRYITAEDVGTCQRDMDIIRRETEHVTGCDPARGGGGDPSPFTARGVLCGIKAAVKKRYGTVSLQGLTVAVQGLGNVGYNLCRLLAEEGARLVVTDINTRAVQKAAADLGAAAVSTDGIYEVQCDVFAPCALGAVVNDETLDRFKCAIIAGAANNVLAAEKHGDELRRRNILYVPDYVINAGGLINVADELIGYQRKRVEERVARVYNTVLEVLNIAECEGIPTHRAADLLAEQRIQQARIFQRAGRREVPKVG